MRILTVGEDNIIRVWNVREAALLTLPGQMLAWSSDGAHIATSDEHDQRRVWDANTGEEQSDVTDWEDAVPPEVIASGDELPYLHGYEGKLDFAAMSPDGAHIFTASTIGLTFLSGERVLAVWDVTTGRRICTLSGHTGVVDGAGWSPDGTRLITASGGEWYGDGTIRLWAIFDDDDVPLCAELSTLYDDHVGPFASEGRVLWSPDGTRFAISAYEGTQVWQAWPTVQDLIDYARQCCLVRELTDVEREQFNLPPRP